METSKSNNILLIMLLMIYLALTYGIYYYFQDNTTAEIFFDTLQLIAGLGAGIFILKKGLTISPFNYKVYIGYACLIWGFGQLFWLAYILVGREGFPYPSVAELAFLGAYFFLITSMKVRGNPEKKGISYHAWFASAALVVITGASVLLTGTINTFEGVYSIAYIFVTAWALLFALSRPGLPLWLRSSVSLLCLSDFLLILQVILSNEQILFLADRLYPLVFIMFLLGVRRDNHG